MVLGRRVLVVLAGASMALASFGVASAHESVDESNVSIKEYKKGVKGEVTSDAPSCTVDREVKVFKAKKGKDKKIGTTTTNLLGKWKLNVPNAKGKYYVKAPRSLDEYTDEYFHLHDCGAATSDKVKV